MTRKDDPRLLSDGMDDSAEVRALLVAGGTDEIDYDFDRGLAAHLGAIGVVPGQPGTGASAGASAKVAVSAISSKALLLLIGAPIVAVSAGVALWLGAFGGLNGSSQMAASTRAAAAGAGNAEAASEPPAGAAAPGDQVIAGRGPSTPPQQGSELPNQSPPSRGLRAEHPRPAAHPVVLWESAAALEKPSADQRKLVNGRSESDLGDAPRVAERAMAGLPSSGASASATIDPSTIASTAASAAAEQAEEAALEAAAQRRKASAEEAARAADQRLEREMNALAEAKHALSSDPARALSLAREGDRDFPHGVFAEERRHILILALIRLGRLDEARRLAAPYLEQHPDSPFARRVRTALDAAGSKR